MYIKLRNRLCDRKWLGGKVDSQGRLRRWYLSSDLSAMNKPAMGQLEKSLWKSLRVEMNLEFARNMHTQKVGVA